MAEMAPLPKLIKETNECCMAYRWAVALGANVKKIYFKTNKQTNKQTEKDTQKILKLVNFESFGKIYSNLTKHSYCFKAAQLDFVLSSEVCLFCYNC